MALLQHGIHKSGFTMIDMGDDRNVADIFSDHFFPSSLRPSASIYKSTVQQNLCIGKYNLFYHITDSDKSIFKKYFPFYASYFCITPLNYVKM